MSLLEHTIPLLERYKKQADLTFEQLTDDELHLIPEAQSNSIPTLVKHMHGNMLSRWTNFLSEDGEKTWRDREGEFESTIKTRQEMIEKWEEGWDCLFSTLQSLKEEDLEKTVYIRKESHSVTEAILRQIAHYCAHVGQIVYLGKMIKGENWKSLSIAPGQSAAFNLQKEEEAIKAGQFSENH